MSNLNQNLIIVYISGSTASGKTSLTKNLFDRLINNKIPTKLISCDSVQLYKDITIGCNKDTIDHEIIDIKDLDESFDVDMFVEKCSGIVKDFSNKCNENEKKVIIISGGTIFYMERLYNILSDKFSNKIFYLHNKRIDSYNKINYRCELMIRNNLLLEIVHLREKLQKGKICKSIGYKQGLEFIYNIENLDIFKRFYSDFLELNLKKEINSVEIADKIELQLLSKIFYENNLNIEDNINIIPQSLYYRVESFVKSNKTILYNLFHEFLARFQVATRNYKRKQDCFARRLEKKNILSYLIKDCNKDKNIDIIIEYINKGTIETISYSELGEGNNFKEFKCFKAENKIFLENEDVDNLKECLELFISYLVCKSYDSYNSYNSYNS